ncbi:N-acetylmuramoyl-L-alanine amidase [Paenibacillus pini]|uniref:N-acetylmuramoyl-L-alanine amidase n=1 Tax=Paenibacillus pini JCM 16418 TaxID=1236976 RepID=W7YG47_9BACL|nr:N-acetylmuramoyl-L-alanine amidase [Paenibacillus pini]GAF06523.1 N-acetylmuramoyl-L-alanine amidase [Paenibacillus pini JCM 16418]
MNHLQQLTQKYNQIWRVLACLLIASLSIPSMTMAQSSESLPKEQVAHHPAFPREVILVDAGHGGIDGGTSFQDILEKNINLAIAKKLFVLLRKQGYYAVLNRTGDYALSDENQWLRSSSRHLRDLAQRKELSQQIPTLIVVSLHVNWGRNPSKGGALVLHQNEGRSVLLASAIQDHLNPLYPTRGTIKLGNPFYLLNQVADPAVIVETGFISNAHDRQLLCDQRGQLAIAESIAAGINYFLTAI